MLEERLEKLEREVRELRMLPDVHKMIAHHHKEQAEAHKKGVQALDAQQAGSQKDGLSEEEVPTGTETSPVDLAPPSGSPAVYDRGALNESHPLDTLPDVPLSYDQTEADLYTDRTVEAPVTVVPPSNSGVPKSATSKPQTSPT